MASTIQRVSLIEPLYKKPFWILPLVVLLIAWLTRNLKVDGAWRIVPVKDPDANPCHIGDWGGFNTTRPKRVRVYYLCVNTELPRYSSLTKDMIAYTPESANYACAEDFGSDVRICLYKTKSLIASRRQVKFCSNANITRHSNEVMTCTYAIGGKSVSKKRWTWVELMCLDEVQGLVTMLVTDVSDSCIMQRISE